ncbi:hypothetical protein [Caulobacter sp.]|uniref:hypothetical protein n=1 Tax=Caulobacter sp. TaxID=78 RepID=UPI002B45BB1B|nr:hypothetical protein [Caulobacter sp.]HJV42964.1 hypothetical protein [Caulobacter sp.]
MSVLLTINVINRQNFTQGFYFFQQPALYSGGSTVYSNSLYSQNLGNYDATGAILTFQVSMQYYAAIQQAHSLPSVGQSSGYATAMRPIALAPAGGTANDWTTASVNPLGLTAPTVGVGVQPGAFRITTPPYAPPALYNIGSAVQVNGGVTLSSFVIANPASNTDCQPILEYYVQTGQYTAGTVINFTQSSVNAAICDFTGGYSVINVTLNPDGTWTTQVIQ